MGPVKWSDPEAPGIADQSTGLVGYSNLVVAGSIVAGSIVAGSIVAGSIVAGSVVAGSVVADNAMADCSLSALFDLRRWAVASARSITDADCATCAAGQRPGVAFGRYLTTRDNDVQTSPLVTTLEQCLFLTDEFPPLGAF
jgi:hypothetical protein